MKRLSAFGFVPQTAGEQCTFLASSTRVVDTPVRKRTYVHASTHIVTHMCNAGGKPHTLSPGYAPAWDGAVKRSTVLSSTAGPKLIRQGKNYGRLYYCSIIRMRTRKS